MSALLQSYHLGFQTLKVQKHATQIYSDLRNISSRFEKHFDGIKDLRKKLEQAISNVDSFGRDARAIMNSLSAIKNPKESLFDDDDPDPPNTPMSAYRVKEAVNN